MSNVIALDSKSQSELKHLHSQAMGQIVYWSLSGPARADAIADALKLAASPASPPEAPSATVVLHRAVESVARQFGGEAHAEKRGAYAIVGRATRKSSDTGPDVLEYPVRISAQLLPDGTPEVFGDELGRVLQAFQAGRYALSPQDVSGWLCRKLANLGAVALRESGGFYFVPADVVAKWEKVVSAIHAATSHRIQAIPAMRSSDAVSAVLAAVKADISDACVKLNEAATSGELGPRALESREREAVAVLGKVERYEGLLGLNLEELRQAAQEARKSIAAAVFMLGAQERERSN
jgi:hypothetical protein